MAAPWFFILPVCVTWINARSMTFSFQGAYAVGKITEEQRFDFVRHACPGPGACGGMYTYVRPSSVCIDVRRDGMYNSAADRANTMSSVLEVLGLSLPYSSSTPATFDRALCDSVR